jgi:hypothetical protein
MALPTLAQLQSAHNASAGKRYFGNLMRKASPLLDRLPLDASVNPQPGKPMIYNYSFQKDMKVAQFRAVNADYTDGFVTTDEASVALKIMGDKFGLDRVLVDVDDADANVAGVENFVELNISEIARSVAQLMSDTSIIGNATTTPTSFDGLSKILTGSTSEVLAAGAGGFNLDLSQTDAQFYAALEPLKKAINSIRAYGLEPVIMCNEDTKARLETVGARLGYISKTKDEFGGDITRYAGAEIMDLGVVGSTNGNGAMVIPTVNPASTTLVTDLYVVGLGERGFHGATLTGTRGIKYYSNIGQTNQPDIAQYVSADFIAAVVLKSTRAARVFRDIRLKN